MNSIALTIKNLELFPTSQKCTGIDKEKNECQDLGKSTKGGKRSEWALRSDEIDLQKKVYF